MAYINKKCPYEYPEETDLGKNVDDLYIGSGLAKSFKVLTIRRTVSFEESVNLMAKSY